MPVFAGSASRSRLMNHHTAARTITMSTMIAHIGNPLELEAATGCGRLAAALVGVAADEAAPAALETVARAVWAAAAPTLPSAGQKARRAEGFCDLGRERGGDRVLLRAEQRRDRRRVGPVGRILLAERPDRRLNHGADRCLSRGLGRARILAERADDAR